MDVALNKVETDSLPRETRAICERLDAILEALNPNAKQTLGVDAGSTHDVKSEASRLVSGMKEKLSKEKEA